MQEENHAVPHTGPDRHQGQPLLPGRHDVRRHRQLRPRRLHTHHPQGAGRGHQLRRHRRLLLARRVGGDRRKGSQRPPGQRRPGHQGAPPDGGRPQPAGQLTALAGARAGGLPAPAGDRPRRPVPDPPARAGHRHRGDPLGPHRPGARRQGPCHRFLDLPGLGHRRGAVGRRTTRPAALPDRAAVVLDPRPEHRTRSAAGLSALRDGHAGLESAGRGLLTGRYRKGGRPPLIAAASASST